METHAKWDLWLRWVTANAFAEMIGLGLTFAAGIGLFLGIEPQNLVQTILLVLLMTATGVIEGCILGLAQWMVLRRFLPAITPKTCVAVTLAGALTAWFLGSLPSSFMSLQAESAPAGSAGMEEPPMVLILALAVGMGFILGAVLAFPQWLALRKYVARAVWWLPANSAAWMVGMPVVFTAVGWAYDTGSVWQGVLVMAISLWVTGAAVGAIHGAVLVHIVENPAFDSPLPVT